MTDGPEICKDLNMRRFLFPEFKKVDHVSIREYGMDDLYEKTSIPDRNFGDEYVVLRDIEAESVGLFVVRKECVMPAVRFSSVGSDLI